MHCMTYRITTLQPLLFSTNAGDRNMVATSDYIPGTTLLGLFANRYINANRLGDEAHKNPTFSGLFLEGKVIFSNACIAVDAADDGAAIPLPFSLQQEKNAVPDKVRDLVSASDQIYASEEDKEKDIQYKSIGGFGRWDGDKWIKQPVRKSLNFHHEKDRTTGTSKKGIIFNYESIDAGQAFLGTITGSEDNLKKLHSLIDNSGETIYLGRSRNAQYGKAKFEVLSCKERKEMPLDLKECKVSLTMLSHTIIENKMGFPTTDVTVLEQALNGNRDAGITILESFMRAGEVETFVSVWRLRKPSEACFQAGSRFLLEVDISDTANKERLHYLQQNGLGRRTSEGFGRIALNYGNTEFEVTLETPKEKETDKILTEKETKAELGAMPEKTKEIVKSAVDSLLRKQVEVEALKEAYQFEKNIPRSSSLMGRLEGMVKKMGSAKFQEALHTNAPNSLRKTARDHLEKCNDGEKKTLLDHLLNKKVRADDFYRKVAGLDELVKAAAIDINSVVTADELCSLYYLTFFSAMRRKIKQVRKQHAGG